VARGLFITGTGTGVGKTYVAALIARALAVAGKRVGIYKPVASGCDASGDELVSPDAVVLWEAARRPGAVDEVCPQRFVAPLAPHLAARAEGRQIDAKLLREGIDRWRRKSDIVLVEGAGGLMSPISEEDYNADLAAEFGFPLVIVAANELGTINATLQTLITAKTFRAGLHIAGIILNWPSRASDDPSTASNREELVQRCDVPVLAEVVYGGRFDTVVDWWHLAARTSSG
jgi:dethiobiotin synthetase